MTLLPPEGQRKFVYSVAQLACTTLLGVVGVLEGQFLSAALGWCALGMAGGNGAEWIGKAIAKRGQA